MKNNIKLIREQKNMTQKSCAEKLNITLRAWQTYEQGVSEPKQELLFKIADMFDVSIDYLLGREQKIANTLEQLAKEMFMQEMEKDIFERWLKLKPTQREFIVNILRDVVNPESNPEEPIESEQPIMMIARNKVKIEPKQEFKGDLEELLNAPDISHKL